MNPCSNAAGKQALPDSAAACPYQPVHDIQWMSLREDLCEVKTRVQRLESTLARGVALLVANLVGVIMSLLRQLA
ncbi:MAG TPA: hypothetical protein PLD73_00380 [Candidatus Hydrogenedentes bacterium]|jgi:hypothetical protein|nr:hypothetical protein [Candidatus Hydrogenedentota bacterium]HPJ97950.1 hypothetical protein [Candidatus Hydrogenedentota bacterium]